MTTYAVVHPADIRDDAQQADLGLTRLLGIRFEELADEVYEDDENNTFGWFGLRKVQKRYTRRQIGQWMQEILNDEPRSKDNGIRGWWCVRGTQFAYAGYKHHVIDPVRDLIRAARDLNTQELRVDAQTMRLFEDAYSVGERRYEPEE